ncbi:MAG: hypothetical protein VX706_01315 [Bacteroidota bacterium]|jgi:hypothetical protein|nr:hypothetical protein [Bacteroidota bacterium]|tara:strand:- start:53 stop:391 length:339 start_codon:yes stop_codon:yes gene_type:complete
MILLDLVDVILYFGYGMVMVGAVLAIGFPLWIASKNPKSLIGTGIGLGSILVLFLIAWLISGSEVYSSYSEFGVDASLSKFIGGMLILVYMLVGLALSGIIYSEVTKSLKNG